jgi:hypothetical protein
MIGIFSFGTKTELRFLGTVPITGKQGEPLCLAYKLSMHFFFLPLGLSQDGYVLGIITKQDGDKVYFSTQTFYPLSAEDITRWQQSGHLPNPLPTYKLRIRDHWPLWFGWGFIALAAIGFFLK